MRFIATYSLDAARSPAFARRRVLASAALVLGTLAVSSCSEEDAAGDPSGQAMTPTDPSSSAPGAETPIMPAAPGETGPAAVAPTPESSPTAPPSTAVPSTEDPATDPPATLPTEPTTPFESLLGTGVMGGSGTSSDRYAKADVTRDGQNYFFMANGWGQGFASQTVSWNGTSFTVQSMEGQVGDNYEPASYPTVFCGRYSDQVSKECGLPASLSSLTSVRTGWRWAPNGNNGEYNAAYDIWMAKDDGNFGGFVMVWLRDPVGQQPAGSLTESNVTVANVSGTWNIWTGLVNGAVPIVNWVRPTNADSTELEFDVLDFVRDAQARGYELPGTRISAIAVGFEIWEGPVTNLESQDFYIDVQ